MASNEIDPKLFESKDALKYLELYQKEWEVTINTQMHFNELIIRYRQIFLTLFLTISTASISLYINQKINVITFYSILMAILIIWILAFVLDFFYYHKMLLASVEQAKKFDDNFKLRELGLFGLTKEISSKISSREASIVIVLFYVVPIVISIVALLFIPQMKV